jgi:hypothetical protein
MASVPGKFLNMENIIKKVFDETSDSLRTSASAPSSIIIDAADDSIAIADRDTGALLKVESDGKINTNTNINGVTPVSGRLPVDLGGATVNITGDVTVSNEVEITNDINNPVPVSGIVAVTGVSTLAEQQTQTTQLQNANTTLTNIKSDTQNSLTELQSQTTSLNNIETAVTGILTVQATDLDTRNLVFAQDKVDVTGSTVALDSTTLSALENITATIPGVSTLAEQQTQTTLLTSIDGKLTTVNTRDLDFLQDTVDVTGSTVDLGIATLAALEDININNFPAVQAVSATDLDIRNLTFAQDKVDTSGSVVALDTATLAALENTTVSVSNFPALQQVQLDAASLAALEDINVTVSNEVEIKNDANNPVPTIDLVDTTILSGNIGVSTIAIPARLGVANLANRKFISITPRGSGIYIGDSTVTVGTGTPVFLNQTMTLELGPNVTLYIIGTAGTTNVRIIEGA